VSTKDFRIRQSCDS